MDVIEVPSHFMENYVNDARTLPLFMPDSNKVSTARKAEAMAKQVKQDRHMFGALDLETQASFASYHMRVFTCHLRTHSAQTTVLGLCRCASQSCDCTCFDWFAASSNIAESSAWLHSCKCYHVTGHTRTFLLTSLA